MAIVAHHPQAVYFGMKSGFVPDEPKPDELIAGTDRGGELPPDEDLGDDGTIESEVDEPAGDRLGLTARARAGQSGAYSRLSGKPSSSSASRSGTSTWGQWPQSGITSMSE